MQVSKAVKILLFCCIILSDHRLQAQAKITYEKDIKPILQSHCVKCHQPGEVGPFSLQNYDDVKNRAKFISYVTSTRYMPPWKADTSFRHFLNENVLSDAEISLIQQWIDDGQLQGKVKKEKFSKKNETDLSQSFNSCDGLIDSFYMRRAFQIPDNGKEEFRFFHLPIRNKDSFFVKSIRFIPGNRKLVHHARIMCDTTGVIEGIDGLSAEDPHSLDYQSKPLSDPFLFGWVPGNDKISFPAGTGKKFYPNTSLILNIHYAPSPLVEYDSSAILIEYGSKEIAREIRTITLIEEDISNKPFLIKPNSKPTFYMRSKPMEEDISLVSILPHMHVLGKSFRAFAVSPEGDAIPLINIPSWDFNWQMTYSFSGFVKIPKGSIIYAEATYDNTAGNPRNPNTPPKYVGFGWGTKDEMMNLVMYYVPYKTGDELVKF